MANPFESEVARSAKLLGIHYQRLPLPPRRDKVILKKNPYDAYAVHRGRFHAFELKSQNEHGKFSWPRVETHQVDGLHDVLASGGEAWLLLNMRRRNVTDTIRCRNPLYVKGGTEPRFLTEPRTRLLSDNRMWAFHFRDWDAFLEELRHPNGTPRKSIPYSVIVTDPRFIPVERVTWRNAETTEPIWSLSFLDR